MSKMMTWAEDQGYRPEATNPCRKIQRYKTHLVMTEAQSASSHQWGTSDVSPWPEG